MMNLVETVNMLTHRSKHLLLKLNSKYKHSKFKSSKKFQCCA